MTSGEQIALARRIADEHRGTGFDRYEEAVLAAIIETTELAAKFAGENDGYSDVIGSIIADELRNGAHLKGPTHDEQ